MSEQAPENTSTSTIREDIHRRAAAFGEASVYSMNNTYLTRIQKAQVEAIFQAPIGLFGYVLLGHLAFVEPRSYIYAYLIAAFCNIAMAIPLWFAAHTALLTVGFFFAGTASTVIDLGLAGYLGYQGAWLGVGLGIAAAFGLLSFVTPSMWIYVILGHGMHPKYRIAKKLFGIRFPFEDDLV